MLTGGNMLDDIQPDMGKVFIDCGAHTVHTGKWKVLPIDDYIEFCNKHNHRMKHIAAPDVVGNTEETKKNFKYFMERIDFDPKKVLGVYHLQAKELHRFEEVMDYHLEYGLTWIGIGGALGVGFTDMQKLIALEQVYKRLDARGRPLKVHLFGIPDPTTIRLFRPESVDSANFIYRAKQMNFHRYDYMNWKIQKQHKDYRKATRAELTKMITDMIFEHKDVLIPLNPEIGDYDLLYRQTEKMADGMKFLAINGLNIVQFEKFVRKELDYDFTHHITYPISMARRYPGVYADILQYIWKDRALVSYSQVWEMSSALREKDMTAFG